MTHLKFALRQLLKSPAFTFIAALSIAVGIGANAVVFTWIRATLFEAIPGVAQPGQLTVVTPRHVSGSLNDTMSLPDLAALAAETNVFAGLTASQMGAVTMRTGEQTEWLWCQHTMANYFDVLGVAPELGRGFLPGEDRAGAGEAVAVISHDFWQRRFSGDPAVLNRVVELNSRPVTIVGIAPPRFQGTMGGLKFDIWVPLATQMEAADLRQRETAHSWRWLHTVARLQPAVSLREARAAADTVGRRLAAEFPESNRDLTIAVLRVWESPWGGQGLFLPLLRVLALVALLLLGLVIANVANLLLARALARRSEMAVRLALGAGRGRLIRQLLVESLLLAFLGGAGGVVLAQLGARALISLMPPTYLPLGFDLSLDGQVLLAATALTVVTGLLFGLAPAWQAARTDLNETLKAGGRAAVGDRRMPLRAALVMGEVALALVLLVAMGLCARSFQKARQLDLGLKADGVVVAGFRLSPRWGEDAAVDQFYRRLRAEAERLPGVESVALADWLPLGFEGGDSGGVGVPGYQRTPGENMDSGVITTSPGLFETLRIPWVTGRDFRESDNPRTARVAVVNEEFVRRWLGGRDPLGLKFEVWGRELTIIGVVKTGKYRFLNEAPRPYLFLSNLQLTDRDQTLVVRAQGDLVALGSAIERTAAAVDPTVRPFAVMDYPAYVAAAFSIPRVAATLLAVLGGLALLMSALGIYGVMSQHVGQRTREMGVRLALGARPADVRRLILLHGLRLAGTGLILGLVGGVAASRLLAGLLVAVSPADATTWLTVPLGLLAATTLACWWPARRASRIEPMVALRNE